MMTSNAAAGAAALFFLAMASSLSLASSTQDGQALLDLKNSMYLGPDDLSSWKPGSDPCTDGWTGIECTNSRVTTLKLSNMTFNSNGTTIDTSHLSRLTMLTRLSLEESNLTGELSPGITTLEHLRFVNISHNQFVGTFPANLSGMLSLVTLDTYNNNFTGELPQGLAGLHHLEHLHLGGSYFTGCIPTEYGSITSLRYLALSGNGLDGNIPPELGNLSKLQHLYLGYYNNYSSEIPPELGNLKSLIRLDLSSCYLVGPIPPELGNLAGLDTLFLQMNDLTGPIPDSLGKLSLLRSLDLSSNSLVGEIPSSFNALEKLELLGLFRNNLSGPIPSFIGDLPNLQVLLLWQNEFMGEIPGQLGSSGALKSLDLSKNQLNGSIPPNLCKGRQLQILILRENQLSGEIPDSLGDCPTLERVRLGENQLQGNVPRGFFSIPNLNTLELLQNRLDGTLDAPGGEPIKFSSSNLTTLDLSENLLKGGIPSGLSQLRELKKLCLGWNRITGPLPPELGDLDQLIVLNVSHNQLYGTIPSTIGRLKSLTFLDASSNSLRGSLPASMFQIPVLGVLNLSRNFLDGTIPFSFANSTINSVDLSFNRLEGEIPRGDDQIFNASSDFQGNAGLCGAPLRACPRSKPLRTSARHDNGDSLLAWLVGALFAAAFLVLVLGVCCFLRKYRYYVCGVLKIGRNGKNRELPCVCCMSSCCCCSWWNLLTSSASSSGSWKLTAFQKLDFSAAQVLECMIDDNIIGRGGSGVVYRGLMPSGEVVAVKRLASTFPSRGKVGGSIHADHGFSAEVETLGKIRHRNIVKLLGCCSNKETNVLVYEYMPNGSLGEALHSKKGPVLDWTTRYKVALQSANGLCYLHHDCSPLIVHRDVKSNNILLDVDFQAHVADFGLAKLFQDSGKSESMSSIAGSYGYIAPEYAYTLKVNEKSDIYSFGVVLLELVTGRRPIEPEFGDGVDVVQWARKKIQSKDGMLEVLDSRIAEDASRKLPLQEVMLLLRVALLCTNDLPADRPTMRDVVQMLADVRTPFNKTSSSREDSSSSAEEDFFGDMSSSQLISSPSLMKV